MTQEHPIIPLQWQMDAWQARIETMGADVPAILLEAAQWGADQELEALLTWLRVHHFHILASDLLAARRPKPSSLKEQALAVLDDASDRLDAAHENTIRRALEQLDD